MSESLKGLGREEVAARRAALTDGRWRNREGIGMYQRSTSNALRNILTGVKDDDEERAEGSPPKRAKSNKGKSKAKAPAKKGKTAKAKPRKKAEATRAISVEPEPEPERTTPPPQDIMVPLQDSPPPRPKDKRRRYTLMPVRTKEEMAHPDYDPIDCIGWQ
ncbi:hypothetical protein FRC11_012261 [Ceratobasidium sp. 423]|nr:hypothetical protein FRC11_012261 [Ceratobasidium sp. 423]